MKKLFTQLIALMAVTSAWCQTSAHNDLLVLQTRNGRTVTFALDASLQITFEASEVLLTAGDNILRYPMADVLRFTFANQSSAPEIGTEVTAFDFTGNRLSASGLPVGIPVTVFTTAGSVAVASTADATGGVTIDLSGLAAGVYIVACGPTSCKIVKQ